MLCGICFNLMTTGYMGENSIAIWLSTGYDDGAWKKRVVTVYQPNTNQRIEFNN